MNQNRRSVILAVVVSLSLFVAGCTTSANSRFWGQTEAPRSNVLRYISGSEPESLDPQVSTGQPEARVYMALYEGLVEYDPKTMQPIPAIAESWETAPTVDEFVFHLRKNAKWSDGKPITARDFVYSLHRGFAPETASRSANLGYYIKYSEAYNGGAMFARGKNGEFLLANDFAAKPASDAEQKPHQSFGADTEFERTITLRCAWF